MAEGSKGAFIKAADIVELDAVRRSSYSEDQALRIVGHLGLGRQSNHSLTHITSEIPEPDCVVE